MKIAVTGATGMVGKSLVSHLLERNDEVWVLSRNPDSARKVFPHVSHFLAWQPDRPMPEAQALDGIDAVVHLAGENVAAGRWTGTRKRAIRESRVEGTANLMEDLARLERPPSVIVGASAIGYYGDRGDEVLEETAPPGEGFLAEVCQAWEERYALADLSNTRRCIVRVGLVLGNTGGALPRMLTPFKLGLGGRLGHGRQWMSWIHLNDLTALILAALHHEAFRGVIHGTAPHPVTNADFTRTLGHVLGRPTLLPAPSWGLRLALGEMADMLLASQRTSARRVLDLGFSFQWPELEPAMKDLTQTKMPFFS